MKTYWKQQLTVIRPLVFCEESLINAYAELREFPIIPCNLCGSQPKLQRQIVKKMLNDWESEFPGRKQTMMTSLKNVHTSHLFDHEVFDFNQIIKEFQPDQ